MKNKSSYLDLYNFDEPCAEGCEYVLTSPRSLDACKQVGVKPIELLPRSIQDFEPSDQASQRHAAYEASRLSKLGRCREVRDGLILECSRNSAENDLKQFKIADKNVLNESKGKSKKRGKSKESNNSHLNPKAKQKRNCKKSNNSTKPKNTATVTSQNSTRKNSKNNVLYLKGGGELGTKSSGHYFEPLSPVESKCPKNLKHTEPISPVYSRKNLYDSFYSAGLKKKLCSSTLISTDSLNNSRKSSTDFSTSTNSSSSSGCFSLNKSCYRTYKLKPLTKRISASVIVSECDKLSPLRGLLRKNGSLCFLNGIYLSEHDRRILELMAYKKEMDREYEKFSYKAHLLWEQELKEKHKHEEIEAQKWKEYVANKRRAKAEENAKKLEEVKLSLRRSKELLEKSIEEKEFRANKIKSILQQKKILETEERNLLSSKRKAEVEYNQQQLELETTMLQESWQRQTQEKLKKAAETRRSCQELYRRRVASANRIEEVRHQERFKQVQMETETELQRLREQCRKREEQAELKYQALLMERDRGFLLQSDVREQRQRKVHSMHHQLEAGFKKWQAQVLELQYEASEKAKLRAAKDIEEKKERVAMENKSRMEHHNTMMRRVSEEEQAKSEYLKEITRRKEAKMGRLQRERENSLMESRMQAQTTAHLREHIRRTLSPETFDRKVARVALEMRISGRPPTASPTMTRSHILLG